MFQTLFLRFFSIKCNEFHYYLTVKTIHCIIAWLNFTVYFYFLTVYVNFFSDVVVSQVTAIDNDDPDEGNNARLTYSLEKNVIDEASGTAIFTVDKNTGEIRTALCCLDRERTHYYALQVVATDGGGLKG